MLERQTKYTKEQLDAFRSETVHQRRERISLEIYEACKETVKLGPFKGLKLKKNNWWGKSDLGSMCLGLYEKELLDFIFSDATNGRNTFIDVGAADGYYAIGLLNAKKADRAICFELSEKGQNTIRNNWILNNEPGHLEVYGDVLQSFIKATTNIDFSKTFMIVDIEGAEFEFLTSNILNHISKSIVILEVHNWVHDFLHKYSELLKNVEKYFEIEVLDRVERPTTTLNELRALTDDNRLLLTSEARPCLMRFLVLRPR